MPVLKAADLLTFQNPRKARLEPLSRQAKDGWGREFKTRYTGLTWDRLADERFEKPFGGFREKARERLTGKLLIDLGCDNGYFQWMIREIAIGMRIRWYVGVDLTVDECELERDRIQVSMVRAEMLDFVSRLPDGSANFMLTGIDSSVICVNGYHREFAAEIHRATEDGGLVFGSSSEVFRFLGQTGFERIDLGCRFHMFEKK